MVTKVAKKKESISEENNFEVDNKGKLLYPVLLFVIWLITYISCQFLFEQKLGWDEVSYMSVAKGIAEDFDFSSRAYTIMGLIKQGFPSNLINFPVYSIYLAVFFKLFGTSLQVAYFSTWFTALGVTVLIYLITQKVVKCSRGFAFIVALSYLLTPGLLRNYDSAMMEQAGLLLLCSGVYLFISDADKGRFDFKTIAKISIMLLALWLYKSLFLGIIIGVFAFLLASSMDKISGEKIKFNIPAPLFIVATYGVFGSLYILFQKLIFLPVSPMMSFTPDKDVNQTYADFLGGFFDDVPGTIAFTFNNFLAKLSEYFTFPTAYTAPQSQFLVFLPYVVIVAISFILFTTLLVLAIANWNRLERVQKLFLSFSLTSIISFNIIFNLIVTTTYQNMWRYNLYYLPLFLVSIAIIIKSYDRYLHPFYTEHRIVSKLIPALLVVFLIIPLHLSMVNVQTTLANRYNFLASYNAQMISKFVGRDNPKFIYFNNGTHTTFLSYPTRQIFKDATNEQILEVNNILPSPIEYLFLTSNDWIFRNNSEQIMKGQPIINGKYHFVGYDKESQVVAYKLVSENEIDN